MFQTYEPKSDRSFAKTHLPLLRAAMKAQGLDGLVVPHDDEYLNEYLPDHAERLMWVSGFSGSAGSALVLQKSAHMFTDGRYTLQVRDQVDGDFFSYEDVPDTSPAIWLAQNAQAADVIGYDPMLHSKNGLDELEKAAVKAGFTLKAVAPNPIDVAWTDKLAPPLTPTIPHPDEFTGKSSKTKRDEIAASLTKRGVDVALLTAPHSLAWLFNIRGADVHATPIPLGRALIHKDGTADLFLAPEKVSANLKSHLGNEISVSDEAAVVQALSDLGKQGKTVLVDPDLAPVGYINELEKAGATIVLAQDPCALPRATKNETEKQGTRDAHIRDGVAITKFLYWLATDAQSGDVTEIEAASKLEALRKEDPGLRDISFDSISAAGSNGAHCHYRVTTETNKTLERGILFLIDSGGQYPDGTTDITRTVPIGEASAEMKDRYTRVLKGHIALATARFPKGTTGHQLDILARLPLYQVGLDYDHGTGHGVGSFLGVHEGPQNISKKAVLQPLLPGMICSNEPGFYKAGEFGIRIENLVIVTKEQPIKGGERPMMGFETITMAPLARDLIMVDLLTEDERSWVDDYHAEVRTKLGPSLDGEVKTWMASQTAAL